VAGAGRRLIYQTARPAPFVAQGIVAGAGPAAFARDTVIATRSSASASARITAPARR
jgi:hypothetical protein